MDISSSFGAGGSNYLWGNNLNAKLSEVIIEASQNKLVIEISKNKRRRKGVTPQHRCLLILALEIVLYIMEYE